MPYVLFPVCLRRVSSGVAMFNERSVSLRAGPAVGGLIHGTLRPPDMLDDGKAC